MSEQIEIINQFKAGSIPVLGFNEHSVQGKTLTMLYIDPKGYERELQALRNNQLRYDGSTEVLTYWKACLDPDASNRSFIRLDCKFRPFAGQLNLLFTLPDSIPALQSIQANQQIGIITTSRPQIEILNIQPTRQNFTAAFEVPRYDGLDSWLFSYGFAYAMAGLLTGKAGR